MTDKQINFVKKLDKTVFFDGDTIQFNFIEFDKPIKGVCFNKSVYIPIEELEYILQQLFDKEQECERLKKVNEEKNELLAKLGCPTIATARMKAFTLQQQLDQLKKEREALGRAYLETNELLQEKTKECTNLKAENDELKKNYFTVIQQRNKAEQTLAEIKEIAEKGHKERGNLMRTWWFKDILQKISEVEDEI